MIPAECADLGGESHEIGTDCTDDDEDGAANVCEECPDDPNKTEPGTCGCGVPDKDDNDNDIIDCVDDCLCDVDGNGIVNVTDIELVILQWGSDDPAADIDDDGVVDVDDLVAVLLCWGPCP